VLAPHAKRPIILRDLLCILAAIAIVVAGPTTAHAAPSPQSVEDQIDKAWNQLEPVIEQYNQVHSQLQTNRAQAKKLSARLAPLQRQVDTAMTHVGALAANAYMQGSPSSATVLLVSGSTTGFIDKLTYLDVMARNQRQQVSGVAALRDKYAGDKQALDIVTANLAKRDADLAGKKKVIEKKIKDLQKLRVSAYGAGGASKGSLRTGPCPAEYTNDAGGKAAAKACSLIGKPYIWAAAGPNGYDCSGLTLVAWASAGVSLRHFTQWQWQDAKPVSRGELKPGDLVFYYSDLHHMGMYVGNNTIVHAPHTGDYVRMAPLDHGPIAGYRRPA
jgi:cell wall-associated NlpC family hydrolase